MPMPISRNGRGGRRLAPGIDICTDNNSLCCPCINSASNPPAASPRVIGDTSFVRTANRPGAHARIARRLSLPRNLPSADTHRIVFKLMTQPIIIVLLSAFFLFASSIKIFAWQKFIFETQLGMFIKYGLNRQIMRFVGLLELSGAIAIWFQASWLGALGALAILGTSIGAIGCHLIWDTWKDGLPALITTALSGIIVWSGLHHILGLLGIS
jgi:hypothetical protein